jgi:hypothetical protein
MIILMNLNSLEIPLQWELFREVLLLGKMADLFKKIQRLFGAPSVGLSRVEWNDI